MVVDKEIIRQGKEEQKKKYKKEEIKKGMNKDARKEVENIRQRK